MINIEATTLDLRVGDVWDGKEIVAIASPPVKEQIDSTGLRLSSLTHLNRRKGRQK